MTAYWQEKYSPLTKAGKQLQSRSSSWPFHRFPNRLKAMPPAPLKGSCRTHFCSFLCLSTAASISRFKWSHGGDYSSKGLGRDRNTIAHPNNFQLPDPLLLGLQQHRMKQKQRPGHG